MAKKPSKSAVISEGRRTTKSLTIKKLMDEYMYRIDLDADYQREKVWSKKDQGLLLDSIVNDIDIPKLYLARVHGNKQFDFECIDGKQRLATISSFLDPEEDDDSPLRVTILNKRYTLKELKEQHPTVAKSIEDYELQFVIYEQASLNEEFIREIFRRLQLGIRLNSGEHLNSQLGNMRDFVFKEIGGDGPFFRRSKLSDRRYSRQFTLAQICINSFSKDETGDFVRARLKDLEDFFANRSRINKNDKNLERIKKVLGLMDESFGDRAQNISSRAIAVTAYLFVEELWKEKKASLVPEFVDFYIKLLDTIDQNMTLISEYKKAKNRLVMEEFQKYVLQASVESYSIRRRHDFVKKAFEFFRKKQTIVGE